MTFLCDIVGSRKLVEEGRSKLALLRRIDDPPLTDGSVCPIAFLRLRFGSRKLIGKGVLRLTFLCLLTDPPLTGGSVSMLAFLRF